MIVCPICKAQLDDNAQFCPACGTQFVTQSDPNAYAQQNYQQQGYDPNAYAQQNYQQQGYDPNAYAQQNYQQQGYDPNAYAQQNYQQQGYDPNAYAQQNYQQQNAQPAAPKKKGKGVVIAIVAAVLVVLGAIGMFAEKLFQSQGYGDGSANPGGSQVGNADNSGAQAESDKDLPATTLSGKDVFQGERFDEMLWGYYELENYKHSGSFDDTATFRQDMKYFTVDFETTQKEVSILPVSIHLGTYAHFMNSFTYEDEFYSPYTPLGKAMFRKAYMAQYGDLSEEDFLKIEKILNLMVAELTAVLENGATATVMTVYKVEGNFLNLYSAEIDEKYNVVTSEKPILQYEFLHDGSKLTLACQGLQRIYYTEGYKESDSSLSFSGYALNESQQYKDLEGLFLYQYGYGGEITVYPHLSNGETPVDATMELDVTTGNFTLKWTQRWVTEGRNLQKKDDPTTISGTVIPCTSYGFTDYTGCILFIDGKMYKYLMSDAEYDELRYANLSENKNLSDSEKDNLANAKRNILKELEEAFKAANISATVDYEKGQIALEANFLFAKNSYELSDEGKEYLDKFVDAYASVVFKDDYTEYISRVVVEGHTDTKGSYSMNLELSQNRADSVAQQCIDRNSKMEDIIEAIGCSYDYPIYNDDGSVNMDASRRVTFRFVFTG